jgi:multiple sugar transport system permease protein
VPVLLVLVTLTLYPAMLLLRMSVSEITIARGKTTWTFVGLDHLKEALADPVVPVALQNTAIFILVVVTFETLLGFAAALAISRTHRFNGGYRTILLTPILIPPIAIGVMWRLIYDFNYGLISTVLTAFQIQGPTWTADPTLAMPSIMIVDVWHWTSFVFLVLLAGLESLPGEAMEAARVDGASEWQILRYVIVPLMRSTIVVVVMLRVIMASKVFDQIFLLTRGGPGTATQVISLYVFEVFFTQFRLGYGAFLALGTAILLSIFVILYLRVSRQAR